MTTPTTPAAPAGTVGADVRRVHPWKLHMCAPSHKAKVCLREIARYHKQNPGAKRRGSKYLLPNVQAHVPLADSGRDAERKS